MGRGGGGGGDKDGNQEKIVCEETGHSEKLRLTTEKLTLQRLEKVVILRRYGFVMALGARRDFSNNLPLRPFGLVTGAIRREGGGGGGGGV